MPPSMQLTYFIEGVSDLLVIAPPCLQQLHHATVVPNPSPQRNRQVLAIYVAVDCLRLVVPL